jgi:hypothetical protein
MSLLGDWERFLNHVPLDKSAPTVSGGAPVPTPIYISTKTYIAFLTHRIDLKEVFWRLPIIRYTDPTTGIIKKQIKFNSASADEVADITERVSKCLYAYDHVISHVAVEGKFKDIRKVTVGISKKDILSYRVKQKGAFYNCFVVIVRINPEGVFKEFHIKVFNTGKIEIPGVQDYAHLTLAVDVLISCLKEIIPGIKYTAESEEIVLINSNFNCGFFIKREELYNKLRYDRKISTVYDPCSYPGIQCKLYYDESGEISVVGGRGLSQVSVMIFRTGSVLIVGKCDEVMLDKIYTFLNDIFSAEYATVHDVHTTVLPKKEQKRKYKKIVIQF